MNRTDPSDEGEVPAEEADVPAPSAEVTDGPPTLPWRRPIKLCAAIYLFLLGVGLVLFIPSAPLPPTESYAAAPPRGGEAIDLARYDRGARVVASSAFMDVSMHHHPLFAIDGWPHRSGREMWVSNVGDPRPWIEVLLPDRYDVEAVVLDQDTGLLLSDFEVACLRGDEITETLEVTGNRSARSRHPMACPDVDAIRLTFTIVPGTLRDVTRIHEIEVWGR